MRLLWGAALRTAISLCTGVGGLDFGLEAAGFSTAVALECDAVACSTILLNRKWPVIKDDARRSAVELLQAKRRIYPVTPKAKRRMTRLEARFPAGLSR